MKDALVKGLLGDAEELKQYAAKRGGPVLAEMVDEGLVTVAQLQGMGISGY